MFFPVEYMKKGRLDSDWGPHGYRPLSTVATHTVVNAQDLSAVEFVLLAHWLSYPDAPITGHGRA